MNEPTIRVAMLPDAGGIAHVHVESWKTTYVGLIPPEIIAVRTFERRLQQWTAQLSQDNPMRRLLVAELDGRIVAYAQFGTTRWPDLPFTHELYAIYCLHEIQGRGIGKKLVREGVSWMSGNGAQSMILWVLRENRLGRGFYERLGGEVVAERIDPDFSEAVIEVAYGWQDMRKLEAQLSE